MTSLVPITASVPARIGRNTCSGIHEVNWLPIMIPGMNPTSSEPSKGKLPPRVTPYDDRRFRYGQGRNGLLALQAKLMLIRRRRIAAPITPKPAIIMAQVADSGTGVTIRSLTGTLKAGVAASW